MGHGKSETLVDWWISGARAVTESTAPFSGWSYRPLPIQRASSGHPRSLPSQSRLVPSHCLHVYMRVDTVNLRTCPATCVACCVGCTFSHVLGKEYIHDHLIHAGKVASRTDKTVEPPLQTCLSTHHHPPTLRNSISPTGLFLFLRFADQSTANCMCVLVLFVSTCRLWRFSNMATLPHSPQ